MRFFKYLIVLLALVSPFSHSATTLTLYQADNSFSNKKYSSPEEACNAFATYRGIQGTVTGSSGSYYCKDAVQSNGYPAYNIKIYETTQDITCPSATSKSLSVPINSSSFVCVDQCQYALQGCVNVQFNSGGNPDGGDSTKMSCNAISTGKVCKSTNTQNSTTTSNSGANSNNDGSQTATNSATSNSTTTNNSTSTSNTNTNTTNNTTNNTSTSTSTTTTNTTNVTNTTTNTIIDLSSLENTIVNTSKSIVDAINKVGDKIKDGADTGSENGSENGTDMTETNKKLDDIKKGIEDSNEWGKEGADGELPTGEALALPEKTLEKKTFSENIFASSAQCPANKTLSMSLLGARSFSYSFDFTQWCYYLGLLGQMILIGAYLHGANIITRS